MKSNTWKERFWENLPPKILSVLAAALLVFFHHLSNLQEKQFNIAVEILLPENLTPLHQMSHRTKVRLRGEEEDLGKIQEEDLLVLADFRQFEEDGRYSAPLVFRPSQRLRELNITNLEVNLDPIELNLELRERQTKSLPVGEPSWLGAPVEGYRLVRYYIIPPEVQVSGPGPKIQDLESIAPQPIDLEGKDENFSQQVRLENPDPAVEMIRGDFVEIQVVLEEVPVRREFRFEEYDLILPNRAGERAYSDFPIIVELVATPSAFQNLNLDEVKLTLVIPEGSDPSLASFPLEVEAPEGFEVGGVFPDVLELDLWGQF